MSGPDVRSALPPVLAIEDLTIALPRGADRPFAVEGVSLAVERNEVVCLVGESGSGKSMIAHSILSLLPKGADISAGTVRVEGRDVTRLRGSDLRDLRGGKAAMVFQEPLSSLNPLKRVGRQVAETILAHAKSLEPRPVRDRVVELFAQVGLPHPEQIVRRFPFELSGGQRQRVMIAMAMANRPALLVADEPTTALDVTTQRQILRLVDDLRRERGMGVLLITHDFGVVAEVADRVVVLRGGRIVEQGPIGDVLRRPAAAYTRELLDAVPKGEVTGRTLHAAERGEPLLAVEGLRKTFRTRRGWFEPACEVVAADGISLVLRAGETLAVVGESGSGKSTLGRMIMRLTEPDAGSIRLDGADLRQLRGEALRQARRNLQVVFQDPFASLDPRQKVGDAIARGPMAFGATPGAATEAAKALLIRVGLGTAAAERFPHEFSGGQRQRICIARAVALKPKVLIADEAVSALDVSVQAQVLALLAELRREMGMSMIFITHDLRIAAEIADRVLVLRNGQVVEEGPTGRVFSQPQDAYTRELLGAIPGHRFFEPGANADMRVMA